MAQYDGNVRESRTSCLEKTQQEDAVQSQIARMFSRTDINPQVEIHFSHVTRHSQLKSVRYCMQCYAQPFY